jgi:hypothetical protein
LELAIDYFFDNLRMAAILALLYDCLLGEVSCIEKVLGKAAVDLHTFRDGLCAVYFLSADLLFFFKNGGIEGTLLI